MNTIAPVQSESGYNDNKGVLNMPLISWIRGLLLDAF